MTERWESHRGTPYIDQLYAILVPGEEGPYLEGVARHMLTVDEPSVVALPLITDDRALVERMLATAQRQYPHAYVVVFGRRA